MRPLLSLIPLVSSTIAGTVLWDGRFNDISSSAELAEWSWSNQVGPYQYYIHGNGYVTDYVNLDSSYKNPADSSSTQGVKITIDNTSYWNGQDMRRTELIPQTDAAINKGKVYYHFSISHLSTNPPGTHEEHQIAFFESHFTELKYGLLSGESGTSDSTLRWQVSSVTQWNTTFEAEVWHNMAYEIDFDAGTVGLWHSTGADDLTQVVEPVSATTSSDGADWHLGVLRLPVSASGVDSDIDDAAEDWLFSGVYVEDGNLTTSIVGPAGSSTSSTSTTSAISASSATSSASVSVSAASSVAISNSTSSATAVAVVTSSVNSSSATTSSAAITNSSTSSVSVSVSVSASASTLISSQPTTLSTSILSASSSSSQATPTSSSNTATTTTLTTATSASATATTSSSSRTELLAEFFYTFVELIEAWVSEHSS